MTTVDMTSVDGLKGRHMGFDAAGITDIPDEDEITADDLFLDGQMTDLPMDEDWMPGDIGLDLRADSVSDGLAISLSMRGQVDIEYISALTGEDTETVIKELRGKIFEDPQQGDKWVTADEYLSGNLISKLKAAKKAGGERGRKYSENIRCLRALLPEGIESERIHIAIGSPWIPSTVIDEFIDFLIGEKTAPRDKSKYAVRYDPNTGIWEIPYKTRYNGGRHVTKNRNTYGSGRLPFLYLLEDMLNLRTIRIMDKVPNPRDRKKSIMVINRDETNVAMERQNKIADKFARWVWSDEKRAEKLKKIYEERYGCIRKTGYDGSFLTFPTMRPEIKLFPYQKDAVARIIFGANTLLAHDVGSGKTYVMIAAGMEMRRMGLSKRNMYVVPNNLVNQWETLFKRLYPASHIITADPKSFTPAHRQDTMRRMRDEDADAILIAYSCFDRIPISLESYEETYREKLKELEESAEVFSSAAIVERKKKSLAGDFKKKYQNAMKEQEARRQKGEESEPICFDSLGITALFVDEAHNYKNLPIDSKISNVYGISASGSKKCSDMLEKVRYVQKHNGGRGVVFATGTPITNSITDIYAMQYYLQGGELALMGLSEFDSWVGMFAERETNFEVDVDTSSFRMATRFSKFHNLPELTSILSSVADFHRTSHEENDIPDFKGYTDMTIAPSLAFKDFLEDISNRADAVRSRQVSRNEDNMLKITGDGRKGALDIRLTDESLPACSPNKAESCASAVYEVYRCTGENRAAQLIFCDSSTPKAGFNMYSEMKRLLVARGIPEEEIAFIHDVGDNEKRRAQLFADVRSGKVRVLIGSTFKLGMGVNVQERLIAIHHLDVPWRPSDMVQREGRILRQGNGNSRVFIYRYITEGSFDAYSWQLLETKQRFIEQLLAGSLQAREGGDVDSAALSYAEIKALAIGNPAIKERVEVANRLSRLISLQRRALEEREDMSRRLAALPEYINVQKKNVSRCNLDIKAYAEEKREYTPEQAKAIREAIDLALKGNVAMPQERTLMEYQGFKIVLPAYMSADKPYVNLVREGRYYVPLGAELGMKRRIDNFLDSLKEQRDRYREVLKRYREEYKLFTEELAKPSAYGDEIAEAREKLRELDESLGVELPEGEK